MFFPDLIGRVTAGIHDGVQRGMGFYRNKTRSRIFWSSELHSIKVNTRAGTPDIQPEFQADNHPGEGDMFFKFRDLGEEVEYTGMDEIEDFLAVQVVVFQAF